MRWVRFLPVLLLAYAGLALRSAVRQATFVFNRADNSTVTDSLISVTVSVCGADGPLGATRPRSTIPRAPRACG